MGGVQGEYTPESRTGPEVKKLWDSSADEILSHLRYVYNLKTDGNGGAGDEDTPFRNTKLDQRGTYGKTIVLENNTLGNSSSHNGQGMHFLRYDGSVDWTDTDFVEQGGGATWVRQVIDATDKK